MFLGDRKDDEATELETRDELEEVFELADQVNSVFLMFVLLEPVSQLIQYRSNAMSHL